MRERSGPSKQVTAEPAFSFFLLPFIFVSPTYGITGETRAANGLHDIFNAQALARQLGGTEIDAARNVTCVRHRSKPKLPRTS